MGIIGDLFGGGDEIQVPDFSDEELELFGIQRDLLDQFNSYLGDQINQQQLLQPLLYEALGIKPILSEGVDSGDDKVGYNGMTVAEMRDRYNANKREGDSAAANVWKQRIEEAGGTVEAGQKAGEIIGFDRISPQGDTSVKPENLGPNPVINALAAAGLSVEDARAVSGKIKGAGRQNFLDMSPSERRAFVEERIGEGKTFGDIELGDVPVWAGGEAPPTSEDLLGDLQLKYLQRVLEEFDKDPETDPFLENIQDLQTRFYELALGQAESEGELAPQRRELEEMLLKRSKDALEGNLPVDPTLERNLAESREQLRETLRQNLGPGFETSSAGIEALADFDKRAEELRYGARRGELTLSEQLSGARAAQGQVTLGDALRGGVGLGELQKSNVGQLFSSGVQALSTGQNTAGRLISGAGAVSNLANPGQLGTLSSLFGGAAQPYTNQRLTQFQADVANQQSQQSGFASLLGGVGQLAGTAAFSPLGGTLFGSLFGGGLGGGFGSFAGGNTVGGIPFG